MLKKIDHIGIVVKDLDAALDMHKKAYGLKAMKTETLKAMNVKIAFIPLGEVLIELIEPIEHGVGRIGQFLEEHGEGFHHIAYRVEDIEYAMQILDRANIQARDKEPRSGADESRIAFIEPEFTQNVLIELVERKREVRADPK